MTRYWEKAAPVLPFVSVKREEGLFVISYGISSPPLTAFPLPPSLAKTTTATNQILVNNNKCSRNNKVQD